MKVEGKKILVMGAGKSGIASAEFLAKKGAVVAIYDRKPIAQWNEGARALENRLSVALVDCEIPEWISGQVETIVISPGIPMTEIPREFLERKPESVIGEVELAYNFIKGRIVGITGSNGKTTTTSLVGALLSDAGIETIVGGNIGTPLISLAESTTADSWIVAELSSFQLESIQTFRPKIGVCLNVTPNHMDRYDLLDDYAAAKRRIFSNQGIEDLAILNGDDPITDSWAAELNSTVVRFSVKNELEEGLFLRGQDLISRGGGKEKVLASRDEMKLRGIHNVQNVLAALAIGLACGAEPESMRETIAGFDAVEHRLESIGKLEGVEFFNDSKATSVDATAKALEALSDIKGKIVLIMGGLGKNAPYKPLENLIETRVRTLVLIGEDAKNIAAQLSGRAEIVMADSMNDAVIKSLESAETGDAILLAPACASFDMYRNYEDRGDDFKNAVAALRA